MESANPFANVRKQLTVNGKSYDYFSLPELKDARVGKSLSFFFSLSKLYIEKLPFSIRVLLECALRNCDEFNIKCKAFFSYKNILKFSLQLLMLKRSLIGKKPALKVQKFLSSLLVFSYKISLVSLALLISLL